MYVGKCLVVKQILPISYKSPLFLYQERKTS